MRILFLNDSLVGGGKERRFVQLIKGLNERGYNDLHLITLSDINDYPVIYNYNLSVHVVNRKIKWDPTMFFKLFRLIKTIKPNVVHTWSIMTSFYLSIICKILQIPHISGFIADSNGIKKSVVHSIAKFISFALADSVVGNSIAGLKAYNAPPKKQKLIYNGFDVDRLNIPVDEMTLKEELKITTPFIVVMAARFDKVRDFETFLLAANQLINTRSDITFLAIGKGDQLFDLEHGIKQTNKQFIKFPGFRTDIDAIIKISDIGVLCTNPPHQEGFSNSLMEFMAFGKPVIATEGGGTNELIKNDETGFIIEPRQPGQLADKINSLLDDRSLINKIGCNAKELIHLQFSLDTMAATYVSLYHKHVS